MQAAKVEAERKAEAHAQAARQAAISAHQAEVSAGVRDAYPPDLETFKENLGLSPGTGPRANRRWTPPVPKRFVLYPGAESASTDQVLPKARKRIEGRATGSTMGTLLADK